MKRLHVHVAVDDLAQSRAFYATLFGAEPSVVENDYAKWMLDDPKVNFAISARGRAGGIDHLGIQVESADELAEITNRLKAAEARIATEDKAPCCYAISDKTWAADPQGVRWESFLTYGQITTYGEGTSAAVHAAVEPKAAAACCAPAAQETAPARVAACSLSGDALTGRLDEIARLNAASLKSARRSGDRVDLVYDLGVAEAVEDLVARERQCCGALGFDVARDDDGMHVTVTVPETLSADADAILGVFAAPEPPKASACCGAAAAQPSPAPAKVSACCG